MPNGGVNRFCSTPQTKYGHTDEWCMGTSGGRLGPLNWLEMARALFSITLPTFF